MKIRSSSQRSPQVLPRRSARAFTLVEVMIVVSVFTVLIIAMVSSQIFGLRMYRISEAKLTSTAEGRKALNRVRDEIRSSRLLYVGNGDSKGFSIIGDGAAHTGNALKICATTDTNHFALYYVDPVNRRLNRKTSTNDSIQVIAKNFTNQFVFQAEDFQGNVAMNNEGNRVIKMSLQFYQKEFTSAKAPNGAVHDYFQLQTRISRRAF